MRWLSEASQPGSNSAMTPDGGMPTTMVCPVRRISEMPCSKAFFAPTVTSTVSALRPPVMAFTRSTTSSLAAFMVWVAPKAIAASSFDASMSTAMIGWQPASRAPCTLLRPTPPQPMTTALDPGRAAAVLITAPTPVSTPQAIRLALSRGTAFGIATAWLASIVTCRAKAAVRKPWTIGSPRFDLSGLLRSSANSLSQATCAPSAQAGHRPQERMRVTTAWSPGFRCDTPSPTASTTPAASWP